jgi:hypothetical protein
MIYKALYSKELFYQEKFAAVFFTLIKQLIWKVNEKFQEKSLLILGLFSLFSSTPFVGKFM